MAGWMNACVGLALSLFLLGVCCEASDDGVAGEESKANQGLYYIPVAPQFPPQRAPFYPPRPLSQRLPVAPRRAASFDITSFITYFYLIRALTANAAPTTTPAPKVVPVCVGSFGEWGECSAKCAGTQSRKHSCTGAMEYRPCNGPGEQNNGWYRASNCYEYQLSSVSANKAGARTGCTNLGALLAHVGMRNTTVRTEIHSALFNNIQVPIVHYVGLGRDPTGGGGTWTWEDGSTEAPNLWGDAEPGADDCVVMSLGNPQSGEDFPCTALRNYLCERKIT